MYNARMTYFQKIGNFEDRPPTVVVVLSNYHNATYSIPNSLRIFLGIQHVMVFWIGNAFVADLIFSFLGPRDLPRRNEAIGGGSPTKPMTGTP
jgi:hypothetical protein